MRNLFAAGVVALLAAVLFDPAVARAQGSYGSQPGQVNWTGIYIGANVGEAINHDTGVETCAIGGVKYPPLCVYPAFGKMNALGFLGGVQLGANWQAGPLVIGPEFDYQGSTLNGSMNFNGLLCSVAGPCALSAQGQFDASESMTSFHNGAAARRSRFGKDTCLCDRRMGSGKLDALLAHRLGRHQHSSQNEHATQRLDLWTRGRVVCESPHVGEGRGPSLHAATVHDLGELWLADVRQGFLLSRRRRANWVQLEALTEWMR